MRTAIASALLAVVLGGCVVAPAEGPYAYGYGEPYYYDYGPTYYYAPAITGGFYYYHGGRSRHWQHRRG